MLIHLAWMLLVATTANATRTSYHVPHPIGWMHALPAGETPGWHENYWLNFELSHANIWNNEFTAKRNETGRELKYEADFEQSSFILELGKKASEQFMFGIEVPFASRGGGFLDDFIDQFHVLIGSDRFLRPENADFDRSLKIETDDKSQLNSSNLSAVGNVKLKAKWWPWQWTSEQPGACDCGFAISGQVKIPVANGRSGQSSGGFDYSLLAHLGAPFGEQSGVWFTAGFSYLSTNTALSDWPRRKWAQMYELSFDFGITDHWGFVLQGRLESPIMDKGSLAFEYTETDRLAMAKERVASGWNSLVYWRGTQSFGIRWRSFFGTQVSLLMIEDWNYGNPDYRSDHVYVTNAPDVAFVTQVHASF